MVQLERYVTLAGIVCLLSSQAWSASTVWPIEGCTRHSDILTCTMTTPLQVPRGIREVTMISINSAEIRRIRNEHLFCHKSWSGVRTLSISDGNLGPLIHHLYDNMFECLSNLTTLKLTLSYIEYPLPEYTFAGLNKLTTLQMLNCRHLTPTSFFTALNSSNIIPNLSKLVLHNMNTIIGANIFTATMSEILSRGRNIEELEVSDTRLSVSSFQYFLTQSLCQTLKVLNYSNTEIITGELSPNYRLKNVSPCYKLETVDISGMQHDGPTDVDLVFVNRYIEYSYDNLDPVLSLFRNINTLYLSDINQLSDGKYAYFRNSVVNVSLLYNLLHLDLSNNRVKYMDCVFVSEYIRLESLDLSQNDMEYLTPRFFQQTMTNSLERLDISLNRLWHMESNQSEFETMFTKLIHLDILNLSHNNLSKIPKDMFALNKNIRHLDMSNNNLHHVCFDIEHLINMRYLDISGNSFVNLDANTIHVFKHIYSVQTSMGSVHLKVNLHNNPLQCSTCSNLEFAKWMTTSPIIDTSNEGYACETETRVKKPFDRDVVSEIQHICDRPMILRRTVLLTTLLPVAIITMLVITIRYAAKLVRQKRYDAHIEKRNRQLENNEYDFKYPVFLTYSSLDDDIVLNHLYKDLQHHLRVFCRTDRDLVCIGDRHFRAGRWIFDEVSRCLEMSALLVVVMSTNYCRSDWCIAEMQQAYQQHKQMLLIFIENVDEEDMHPILRDHFRKRVHVKFCSTANGDYELHPDWDAVCSSIVGMLP